MKEEIIDVALRQLRLGGYENLNFGNIASELGITRANIHHHFKNKEGLALEAVKRYVEDESRTFERLSQRHSGDLKGFLTAMEDHLIALVKSKKEFTACVGTQLVRDSVAPQAVRAIALKRFQDEAREVEDIVFAHFENTSEDEEKVKQLAFKITAAMHGIVMMAQITQDTHALISRIRGTLSALVE